MFKTRPIRSNCPVCLGKFEAPPVVVDDEPKKEKKGKKKSSEPAAPVDPTVGWLYQMMFDR